MVVGHADGAIIRYMFEDDGGGDTNVSSVTDISLTYFFNDASGIHKLVLFFG